jgi:hypothetical protein
MRKPLVALLFACGLAACGKDANRLYGSVSQVYPLDFDRVRIVRVSDQVSLTNDQVAIEYQRVSESTVIAKVAKLTVIVGDLANLAGNKVDLTEKVGGLPRGTLQRVESGGTTDFPLEVGNVRFNQEPTVGTDLNGSFYATLAEPAGRTLNGDFQAMVEAP